MAFRTVNITTLPAEMHRDEVAIGYNAFSLISTSLDEHGSGPWPYVFTSFGDYKLPGLIYTTALLVHFFGLSVWSVRIGTAVLATALLPISYSFVLTLLKDKRQAVVTTGLLSVSYWHIFLARTAYEPIAALTVWILALVLLLKGRNRWAYLVASSALFLLSFVFYNVPLLLSPFIIVLYVACFWMDLRKRPMRNGVGLALIVACIGATFMALSAVSAAKSKTTLFNSPGLTAHLQEFKDAAFMAHTPEISRLLAVNKYLFWWAQFLKNYLGAFDVHFLFFSGGKNEWHNLNSLEIGNLNIITLPLLLVGLWSVVKLCARGSREHWFLLGYFLISPIPDALTIDAPVTNRLLDFHFVITILAAIGLCELFVWSKKHVFLASTTIALVSLYCYLLVVFWFRYYYLHAHKLSPTWNETIGRVAQLTSQYGPQFKRIYVNGRELPGSFERISTPYIYFIFYSQLDPKMVQQQAVWDERGGFQTIISVGPYDFDELPRPGNKEMEPILYVTRSELTELDPHFMVQPLFATTDRSGKTIWRGVALTTHE